MLRSHSPDHLSDERRPIRPGTRLPLSCKECSRRKIKCDKKIPCRPCKERGEGNLCQRRASPRSRHVQPSLGRADDDKTASHETGVSVAEFINLKRRVARVEAALKLNDSEPPSRGDEGLEFRENGLAGAIEEAALGIGEIQRLQGVPDLVETESSWGGTHRWFSAIPLSACLAALPSQQESQALVGAFCVHLNWLCGCVHVPTLTRLHDDFWESDHSRDGMFLSLLFAILSNAAYLLDDDQMLSAGIDPQHFRRSAPIWFNCCLATFFRCHGVTRPSLMACQAMVTLNYAFHLSGNTRIHVAICHIIAGTARAMNLHLLGGVSTGSPEEIIRREMGRRVWWHITETEWYFFTYHRYSNLLDSGVYASSIEGNPPHHLTFILASSESSRVLYSLYCTLQPTQNPSYEAVLHASDELEKIRHRFAVDTEPRTTPGGANSKWLHMNRVLGMTLAYRLYLIHRSYFVKSLSDPAYQQSYKICLMVAETILGLADRGLPTTFYRLWDITLYLVAAGIVLSLDLLATNSSRSLPELLSRRGRLNTLVELLTTLADQSGIGARGAKLISHLCAMEREMLTGRALGMRISRDEILNLVYPDKEKPRNNNRNSQNDVTPSSQDVPAADVMDLASFDGLDFNGVYDQGLSLEPSAPGLTTGGAEEAGFAPTAWGGSDAGLAGFSFDVFGVPPDRDRLFGFFSDLIPES